MARLLPAAALPLVCLPLIAATDAQVQAEVRRTELAFAQSMADRDAAAFASFLSKDAVFFSNGRPTRGARQVAELWQPYFQGPQAPFSWEPEHVEVLDSGRLAVSSGPVRDPAGKRIGTFNSVWKREGRGRWKIVLDNGCPACDCAAGR
jgi:ketosteroid isomerase-like protein